MKEKKISIIGIGATGSVLAAALLKQNPDTVCIDPRPGLGDALKKNGIAVTGALDIHVPVKNFFPDIRDLKNSRPDIIFISTKTYHLTNVIKDIKEIFIPGIKIVSSHNGLGTEDIIADAFGRESVFRMSLNFGASIKSLNIVNVNFFDKPNYIGSLSENNREPGKEIAELFTTSGLDTQFVDDIKLYVWRKMIGKCTHAALCAVTGRTIKDVLSNPYTRKIAEGCYKEAIAVAKSMGYSFDKNYAESILLNMAKLGTHKDSMCFDIENKLPTEIDFLGGKIAEYGHLKGIPVPYFEAMTNLVKAIEENNKNKQVTQLD